MRITYAKTSTFTKKEEKKKKKAEASGSKYNKIILFQLINTSFKIHKNNTLKKKFNSMYNQNKLSRIHLSLIFRRLHPEPHVCFQFWGGATLRPPPPPPQLLLLV